ncbi:MAG: hypothetical protein EBV33_09635 [Betaproteobacteria bacterium]|nr:hypothetical protein [Betaproteobacteria bacterium]
MSKSWIMIGFYGVYDPALLNKVCPWRLRCSYHCFAAFGDCACLRFSDLPCSVSGLVVAALMAPKIFLERLAISRESIRSLLQAILHAVQQPDQEREQALGQVLVQAELRGGFPLADAFQRQKLPTRWRSNVLIAKSFSLSKGPMSRRFAEALTSACLLSAQCFRKMSTHWSL